MASITSLEKSIKILSLKLEKRGFKVNLDVFKSGKWADSPPSYVTLELELDYINKWEEEDSYSLDYTFEANGYGEGGTIKKMKSLMMEKLESELKRFEISI